MADFSDHIDFPRTRYVGAGEFLRLREGAIVIDVRTPSEFTSGHIPGAINIPIFSDREREIVGTTYVKRGRIKAIHAGLDLIGGSMSSKLAEAIKIAPEGNVILYCWRGGMRSSSMAWLFALGGLRVTLLEGGYKAYRNYILGEIAGYRRVIVLGGFTGSGKTEILKELAAQYPVVDLEDIACHRGSAFGRMEDPQPTSEQFANLLYEKISLFDPVEALFVEDESRSIGSVFIPDELHKTMQAAPVIAIKVPSSERVVFLAELYGESGIDALMEGVKRIEKRLGGERAQRTTSLIEAGDLEGAATILLEYYDSSYLYSLKKKPDGNVSYIEGKTVDAVANSKIVAEEAKRRGLL